MIHHTTPAFWDCYSRLPENLRRTADRRFRQLKADPFHPSLHLKNVGRFWSARVSLDCRALAVREKDVFIWFWIGSHADYDRLIVR